MSWGPVEPAHIDFSDALAPSAPAMVKAPAPAREIDRVDNLPRLASLSRD